MPSPIVRKTASTTSLKTRRTRSASPNTTRKTKSVAQQLTEYKMKPDKSTHRNTLLSRLNRSRSVSADDYKQIFEKMSKWLIELPSLKLDKESYNHTLYNLYFTWSGLRTACLITTLGQKSSEFAEIFGLGFKEGPYFDIPGNDHIYFINKKFIKKFEPLFQRLEDTHILPNSNAEEFAPDIFTERIKLIGTILGFDKKCVKHGNEIQDNNNIQIFFYVFPIENYDEHSEVFSYGCNMDTPNWINYPIELMKRSKIYLKPLGLKLGFHIMDWST